MGQVKNIKTGKMLKPYNDGSGYLRVKLDGRCCRLHILVAEAFLEKPEGKDIVNHVAPHVGAWIEIIRGHTA